MKHLATISLSLALLLPGAAAAGQDLRDVMALALERDSQLAAARWQREADRERLPQARSLFLPRIQLEAGAERVRTVNEYSPNLPQVAEDRDYLSDNLRYGVGLVQPLFRAESFTLFGQAKTIIRQADLQYAAAEQNLLLRVSQAYFAVLQARDNLRAFDSEARAARELRDRAQRALEVGSGTITDLHNAQARLDLTEAQGLNARNELTLAGERLRRLTGTAADNIVGLRPAFVTLAPEPAAPEPWAEQAREGSLRVRLRQADWELAREEVQRQRAQRYPKVDLVARYGEESQERTAFGPELRAEQRSIGVELSVPLYTGGAVSSQIRQASYQREAALEQLQDARREASLEAESAFLTLQSSALQLKALSQALQSTRSTEASTRRGQELGLQTALDVLNAQRERYATERDLAIARYRHLQAFLQLKAAVGQLDAEAIARVNAYLEQDQ
ncbi:TolC family outer membrane protein [Alkalilimnicola sp. S0819]|uniref:TolC family outer membrane protein n=1 Tax=Alkalilimnicola sp. S0819 TaxID=2613922 RepID=UPI0012614A6C|nr:TolC family outer membrane protein [Alkalilimnicola sp. S0819]KAB7627819.1 TolC family outer membrane protein [Alkalilimnicola sp. S0819]MPQ15450.1 TolC family outer membrane protein [Alkalilimnicola sp. S0819]